MSSKIGPIQTGEAKIAAFDFNGEGVTGSLTEAVVLVSRVSGVDPDPEDLLDGSATVEGLTVTQKVRYRMPGVLYLLQARATDSAGLGHTVSAYLQARAVA